MLEHLNLSWFSLLNANAGLHGWRLHLGIFAAQYLILVVPFGLAALWMGGEAQQRQAAVRALAATLCALTLNVLIGLLWYHDRPFAEHIGHNFLAHAANSSFPSDHATIMFTVALVWASARAPAVRRLGLAMLPLALAVAWARVFLGVHWPLDMVGGLAMGIAMALLFHTAAVTGLCAALTEAMATQYRRLLARPIARGWLRP